MRGVLVAVLAAVFVTTVSTDHLNKRRYWRRRPAFNLESISCDTFKRADLCNCCKDPCEDVECLNNGVCVKGICNCPCGFSGSDCGVDICAAEPCKNNGTCVPEAGEVSCKCADGFTGEFCEEDLCATQPCKNNGTCVPEGGEVSCQCADGFTGELCEDNACEPNPCQNCGRCMPIQGGFSCDCLRRTSGRTCEVIDNIITSPNYPDNYPDQSPYTMQWAIPGCTVKRLRITVDQNFAIESFDRKSGTSQCDARSSDCNDYLQLENIWLCGNSIAGPVTTSDGLTYDVKFGTNGNGIGCTGFNLTYAYID
ncbi:neurogenic locus notch homolog protein 1 isoform X3 [Patella vulgata]|uniref:neurogenic locus notch homolog protein 1 isoform X3 n=1 Tax=Patella vulgata TaxID=6465 RepID=UPI00218035A8|nr:neurogenic locus notch homolog protein 1 isoform X3 [Patella vulgata]